MSDDARLIGLLAEPLVAAHCGRGSDAHMIAKTVAESGALRHWEQLKLTIAALPPARAAKLFEAIADKNEAVAGAVRERLRLKDKLPYDPEGARAALVAHEAANAELLEIFDLVIEGDRERAALMD